MIDDDTAFLAALKALLNPEGHDRTLYPYLLVELDPDRAISSLTEITKEVQPPKVLLAIGRALATLPTADATLATMLRDDQKTARENACVLAAKRTPDNALLKALTEAVNDRSNKVADAAIHALEDIQKAAQLNTLAETLESESSRARQWVLLDILLTHGDPGDVGAPLLPWQRALKILPAPMRHYADNEIKERRKTLAQKTK